MFGKCSSSCKRRGLTLIEVVTALAILSTLLVGMLAAFRKNADRVRTQLAVREATAGVEQLLFSWTQQGLYPPTQGNGQLPGVDGFRWETRVASRQYRETLGVDIVCLEIRRDDAPRRSPPVITLELPVPADVGPLPGDARP